MVRLGSTLLRDPISGKAKAAVNAKQIGTTRCMSNRHAFHYSMQTASVVHLLPALPGLPS